MGNGALYFILLIANMLLITYYVLIINMRRYLVIGKAGLKNDLVNLKLFQCSLC